MDLLDKWPASGLPADLEEITSEITGLNKRETTLFTKALTKWKGEQKRIKTKIEFKTEEIFMKKANYTLFYKINLIRARSSDFWKIKNILRTHFFGNLRSTIF